MLINKYVLWGSSTSKPMRWISINLENVFENHKYKKVNNNTELDSNNSSFYTVFQEAEIESVDAGGEHIQRESVLPPVDTKVEFPDDAFHMVTQKHWEDDIIWNGEEVKAEVMQVCMPRNK